MIWKRIARMNVPFYCAGHIINNIDLQVALLGLLKCHGVRNFSLNSSLAVELVPLRLDSSSHVIFLF